VKRFRLNADMAETAIVANTRSETTKKIKSVLEIHYLPHF
jgi:hypothetical protein